MVMKLKAKYIYWGAVVFSLSYSVYADMDATANNVNALVVESNDIVAIDYKKNSPLRRNHKSPDQKATALPKMIYQVGPSFLYGKPSDIAKVARDGSIVEIEAAEYPDDVAVWKQSDIILRGIGGRAHLKSNGKTVERKAIWVIKGDNVVIENIEFSGAKVPNRNGAGIRMEGTNLTLRNCHFHDNEMGLLTGKNPSSEIIIENSEFNNNTVEYKRHKKLGHNIYIGEVAKFTLKGSYIHDAETGHNVKSRARENYILYNRITDENLGSSYLVDLPNGGNAFVIGNIFHQSSANDNYTLLSFAAERNQKKTSSSLYVINNTFVNSAKDSIFIRNHSAGLTLLVNNLFVGSGKIMQESGERPSNVQLLTADFVNAEKFDYRLKQTMNEVINRGIAPGEASNGFSLTPQYQYVHPVATELRPGNGKIDIGAYEFVR